jgi:3-dehydroquinate dehydratase-2
MPSVSVINGPNLSKLGSRQVELYGSETLDEIKGDLNLRAGELGLDIDFFESNHEGAIIDYLENLAGRADGLIINPGALTHYGYSLRDCLASLSIPIVEVHVTNIYKREEWRRNSVISPVVTAVISGLGAAGYLSALDAIAGILK